MHIFVSALGVSHVMRSINVRYLLTYLLTYLYSNGTKPLADETARGTAGN